MCTNEGCAICPCDEGEIPKAWLQEQHAEIGTGGEGESREDEYGWISRAGIKHSQEGGVTNSGRLGKVTEDSGASHIDHHQKLSKEGNPHSCQKRCIRHMNKQMPMHRNGKIAGNGLK